MRARFGFTTVLLGLSCVALAACGSSGEGGREVAITQGEEGCTPESIDAAPGEKLNLVVTNESGKEPYEVEGEGGTPLEEIIVPEGKTREVGFTVPNEPGIYEIKCYVPGDLETLIDVKVAGAPAGDASGDDVGY